MRSATRLVLAIGIAALGVGSAEAQDMFSPVSAANWTGFYFGAQADLLATKSHWDDGDYFDGPTLLGDMGGGAGVFGGYDYQLNDQFVIGAGAEYNWDSTELLADGRGLGKSTGDGAIKARAGYLVAPTVLAYGSVGYSWGRFDYSEFYPSPTYGGADATVGGLQLGIGVDAMLTSNIMGRIEATYSHYGTTTITESGSPIQTITPSLISVKAGVAFRF